MPSPIDPADRETLADFRSAIEGRAVVAFTGAGVSAESGVPTFRGPGGLWRDHRPEDLATPQAFARDPALVWAWYRWRRSLVARCRPNAAHVAIARSAAAGTLTVVTQNVDGLHGAAGRSLSDEEGPEREPPSPIELHGSLFRDRCTECAYREEVPFAEPDGDSGPDDPPESEERSLPTCPACGGRLRPDVVWFGEALDAGTLEDAFQAAQNAEVCLVVGTSGVVFPAARIPQITRACGGVVIDVNPAPTALGDVAHFHVPGTAAQVLPSLLGPAPPEPGRA